MDFAKSLFTPNSIANDRRGYVGLNTAHVSLFLLLCPTSILASAFEYIAVCYNAADGSVITIIK